MAERERIIRRETISVIDPKEVDEETANEVLEFLNKAKKCRRDCRLYRV